METGVEVRSISSIGRLVFLFHANYKVKYNHCDDYIRRLVGALISSEFNTLNSTSSDPRKNIDGYDCHFLLVNMEKT